MFAIAYPVIDPVAVQWGPLVVRWYALAYVAGILIGWRVMLSLAQRPGRDGTALMSRAAVDDFVVWATLGIILGGRIGYILFYQPGFYLDHPAQALELWHGGMSFHGGLIGVVSAIWLFARRRKISFFTVGDLVCTVVPIGLFFGRIANFINGELYGRPSDVPWSMVFPRDPLQVPRHPSELYEALLEGAVLFSVLIWLVTKHHSYRWPGLTAGAFLTGYGIARIIGEFFRQPDVQLGYLIGGATMGQLLSIPVLLCGLYLIWRAKRTA